MTTHDYELGYKQKLALLNKRIKLDIDLISEDLYILLIEELKFQNNLSKLDTINEITITAQINK
jgi:hypothetical protein